MNQRLAAVKSSEPGHEKRLAEELTTHLSDLEWKILPAHLCKEAPHIWIVDGLHEPARATKLAEGIKKAENAVFLIVHESTRNPELFDESWLDDVLVWPFRSLEVESRFHSFRQFEMWSEVSALNASMKALLDELKEDLEVAEQIQRAKLPERFTDLKGFKIAFRYLAGMRSGGDHFEIAESKDKNRLSILLSDASSYGLSSSLLTLSMSVLARLTSDFEVSCADAVKRVYQDLRLSLKPADRLSLFFGALHRRDLVLRYINVGSARVFRKKGGQSDFDLLNVQSESLGAGSDPSFLMDAALELGPDDRLVWLSDGVWENLGGEIGAYRMLDELKKLDPKALTTEIAFRLKSSLGKEELPAQDCTVAVLDVDPRMLRMIRP